MRVAMGATPDALALEGALEGEEGVVERNRRRCGNGLLVPHGRRLVERIGMVRGPRAGLERQDVLLGGLGDTQLTGEADGVIALPSPVSEMGRVLGGRGARRGRVNGRQVRGVVTHVMQGVLVLVSGPPPRVLSIVLLEASRFLGRRVIGIGALGGLGHPHGRGRRGGLDLGVLDVLAAQTDGALVSRGHHHVPVPPSLGDVGELGVAVGQAGHPGGQQVRSRLVLVVPSVITRVLTGRRVHADVTILGQQVCSVVDLGGDEVDPLRRHLNLNVTVAATLELELLVHVGKIVLEDFDAVFDQELDERWNFVLYHIQARVWPEEGWSKANGKVDGIHAVDVSVSCDEMQER